MKTDAVTTADIARSVWAVPPLAVDDTGALVDAPNRALVHHIEAGGVDTILWGGNANINAMTLPEFTAMAEAIPEWCGAQTWAIPSVGPDPGKLRDHAGVLKSGNWPAAMLLPWSGARDPGGVERMIRDFADRSGLPLILYIRAEDYLPPPRIAKLFDEGVIVALKYAVETGDFASDPYLDLILAEVDRARVVSGIGEIAATKHLPVFDLAGFTAGAVCIAPRRAMAVLKALQSGDIDTARNLCDPIRPLEALRVERGPIPVIHDAVSLSGVADMGTLGAPFSPVGDEMQARIRKAVVPLLIAEQDIDA